MGKGRHPDNGPKAAKSWPLVAGDTDLPAANGEWSGQLDERDVFGHSQDARYLVNESKPNFRSSFSRMFGDGRDGDLDMNNYVNLAGSKSRQYDNLHIRSGGVLYSDGPYLYLAVKNTLQIDVGGAIHMTGIFGTNGSYDNNGVGGIGRGGNGGNGGDQYNGNHGGNGTVVGNILAGDGAWGGSGGAGGVGVSFGWLNFAGAGGGGGGSGSGYTGGGGGGGSANGGAGGGPTVNGSPGGSAVGSWLNGSQLTVSDLKGYHSLLAGRHLGWGGGGAGGARSSSSAVSAGGGGGAGGGAVYIEARRIILGGSGTLISVQGGNGGAGYGTGGALNQGGGGAGGGGGTVVVIGGGWSGLSFSRVGVSGGGGGTGPANGATGAYGFKMLIDLSQLPG